MRLTILLLASGALFAAPATAQTGQLDQVSPSSNVSFNASLPGWSRQQDVMVGVTGFLEGFTFDVASGLGIDTATIRLFQGWGPHDIATSTPIWTGTLTSAGTIQHTVFVDMSAANLQFNAGDTICVEFVADGMQLSHWGNQLSSSGYPWPMHENNGSGWSTVAGNTRIGFETYMLSGPSGPQLSLNAPCPGTGTVNVSNATPFQPVGLAWSNVQGSFTLPGGICAGTTIDLIQPRPLLVAPADANGDWVQNVVVPPAICGVVYIQALDIGACMVTNVLPV